MERYVWELVHRLSSRGFRVNVICEALETESLDTNISIYRVPSGVSSCSRYRQMLGFSLAVDKLLSVNTRSFGIIHSHERCQSHHVSTFHGPSILDRKLPGFSRCFSARIRAWEKMEKDELLSPSVQCILGVSDRVISDLYRFYPELRPSNMMVACPGVDSVDAEQSTIPDKKGCRFIFVGYEWKRKGLEFAVDVVQQFEEITGIRSTLDVYGPSFDSLAERLRTHPNVVLRGWVGRINYTEYAALIHPASKEPFGMVVSEARAHGLPVLVSNAVGAACLNFSGVVSMSLSFGAKSWGEILSELIFDQGFRGAEVLWSWDDLTALHLDQIYPSINV